jgi:hypothetical protein
MPLPKLRALPVQNPLGAKEEMLDTSETRRRRRLLNATENYLRAGSHRQVPKCKEI